MDKQNKVDPEFLKTLLILDLIFLGILAAGLVALFLFLQGYSLLEPPANHAETTEEGKTDVK